MADQVRMADIAERLGLSIVSVSKALAGEKGVSEATRRRVRQVAEELGYRVTPRRRTDTHTIGALLPSRYLENDTGFYWQLYQELARQAMREGCMVLIERLTDTQAREGRVPALITEQKAEGMILIGKPPFDYVERLKGKWGMPVVCLDFTSPQADMDAVVSNSFYGSCALTEHLIARGHRDIGFVGTLNGTDSINDRYLGFVRALMRHKLRLNLDWVIEDRNLETGLMHPNMARRLPQKLPTAFVCNCDLAARDLIQALKTRELRVPEDISVVGYDDYLPGGGIEPPLTTWGVDMTEMARQTIGLFLARSRGEIIKPTVRLVCGQLVTRQSVANR